MRETRLPDAAEYGKKLKIMDPEVLEFLKNGIIRDRFERIQPDIISRESQKKLLEILTWHKKYHPICFSWLEIVPPGA